MFQGISSLFPALLASELSSIIGWVGIFSLSGGFYFIGKVSSIIDIDALICITNVWILMYDLWISIKACYYGNQQISNCYKTLWISINDMEISKRY